MKNISSPLTPAGRPAPQRSCVACRQTKTKREMVRLLRNTSGGIEIDISGKKDGRGAYLCRDQACWEKALKGKQLEHALKVKITQKDLERLGKEGENLLKELNIG